MNRLKAANSVAFASRDVAPGSGTPQYATNGNPGGGIPATIWPAYMFNMIMDELMAILSAAGTTADDTNWSQIVGALPVVSGHGQCRLSVSNATTLLLSPYNGRRIIINGVGYSIPQAGITLSNGGLAASTLYYIYLYNNAGTLTLEASATGHVTDTTAANYGVEIKSGDSSRTLVGMIYTSAGAQFVVPTSLLVLCLSWFNRRTIPMNGANFNGTTTSLTYVGAGSSSTFNFLCWGDEITPITVYGSLSNNTAPDGGNGCVLIDGSFAGSECGITSAINNAVVSVNGGGAYNLTEGFHTAQPGIHATTGGTLTCNIALSGIVRG